MKKVLHNRRLQCIIHNIENSFMMVIKSQITKIVTLSTAGFLAGVLITSGAIYSFNQLKLHSSVGGLETPVISDLSENLETLLAVAEEDTLQEENNIIENNLNSPVTYQTYRVKKGDMIGFIADAFDVTQDTIISVNNIKQSRLIQVGQYLKIPSMPGIIYTVKKSGETPETIAKKYDVDAEKCAIANCVATDTEFTAGTSLFVPDAELDWASRAEINGDLFHKPLKGRYWLSSPYGWRDSPFNTGKRTFHGGIDMAIGQGTPIYAALDGSVTATGFNSTYGNYVIITHHSGYKTLYAHMSQINCKKGNFVYTNTVIGRVGSTGMSTGPHLHFTVYKNGKTVNPLVLLN